MWGRFKNNLSIKCAVLFTRRPTRQEYNLLGPIMILSAEVRWLWLRKCYRAEGAGCSPAYLFAVTVRAGIEVWKNNSMTLINVLIWFNEHYYVFSIIIKHLIWHRLDIWVSHGTSGPLCCVFFFFLLTLLSAWGYGNNIRAGFKVRLLFYKRVHTYSVLMLDPDWSVLCRQAARRTHRGFRGKNFHYSYWCKLNRCTLKENSSP